MTGAGCDNEPDVRVVVAEFQDEDQDGAIQQDETIVLFLDRPLPAGRSLENVRVTSEHIGTTDLELSLSEDRQRLVARVRTGRPDFEFAGVHGVDPASSGLVVDLGDDLSQSIDLQQCSVVPSLLHVEWIAGDTSAAEEGSASSPNGVVDQGDRLRLRFDGPVELSADGTPDVSVPRQLLLSKAGIDRLDDGKHASRWTVAKSGRADEIEIVLGSNPILKISGESPKTWGDNDRDRPDAASAITVNGTKLRPMSKIRSRGSVRGKSGTTGVASQRELDIGVEKNVQEHFDRLSNQRRRLPSLYGSRASHSLTPFLKNYALIAGGLDPTDDQADRALRDVLLLAASFEDGPKGLTASAQSLVDLPRATFRHTATLLPGPDRTPGTPDDLIVIAGGTENGKDALGDLTVVFLSERSREVRVQQLVAKLRAPRADHAAVAVRHDQILIDGGRGGGRYRRSLVELAELLTIERDGDSLFVTEHEVFFTLARKSHTLTLVEAPASADDDAKAHPWVLAFGGVGRNPLPDVTKDSGDGPAPAFGASIERVDESAYFPSERAAVLSAPRLINVDRPTESIERLDLEFDAAFLRHGHRAVGLGDVGSEGLTSSSSVFLFGGTLEHPEQGMDGDPRRAWQIPPIDLFTRLGSRAPAIGAAVDGLVFHLDHENLAASTLEVVPHPTLLPQPKEHFTMTRIPGIGVVIAGGEVARSDSDDEPELIDTAEIYFTAGPLKGQLHEIQTRLFRGRSRHQAYLLPAEGRRFLVLVGGVTADLKSGTDIDIFPLP